MLEEVEFVVAARGGVRLPTPAQLVFRLGGGAWADDAPDGLELATVTAGDVLAAIHHAADVLDTQTDAETDRRTPWSDDPDGLDHLFRTLLADRETFLLHLRATESRLCSIDAEPVPCATMTGLTLKYLFD